MRLSHEQRHSRLLIWAALVLMLASVVAGLKAAHPAASASLVVVSSPEATPMSQATVDDVTIELMAWSQDASAGNLTAVVRVSSAADRPVRFISSLIALTAVAGNGVSTSIAPNPESTLPCELAPRAVAILRLHFRLEPGQTGLNLMIGLQEEQRSGANVVFPLSGGGGASATGGSGTAGADAQGGNAIGSDTSTPEATGPAATPPGTASPSAGACAD